MSKVFKLINLNLTKQLFDGQNANRYAFEPFAIKEGINFRIQSNKINEQLFEVSFGLMVDGLKEEDNSGVYKSEVEYSGVFHIEGFTVEEFDKIIKTNCASVLYPYTRERTTNVLAMTSFPSNIPPAIDFFALYETELKNAPKTMEEAEKRAEEQQRNNEE